MAEDMLMLNIFSNPLPSFNSPKRNRKSFKAKDKWALKKKEAEKRRTSFGTEECPPNKQNKLRHEVQSPPQAQPRPTTPQSPLQEEQRAKPQSPKPPFQKKTPVKLVVPSEEEEEEEDQTEKLVKESTSQPRAEDPRRQRDERKRVVTPFIQTDKRKGRDEHKGQDRPYIKTSSLFRNNPEIPDIQSPGVTQVKEKVFTSDSFEELDLHPHLVSTLNKVLNVTSMTSVQKKTIPVLMAGRDAVVRSQTGSGKTLAYGIPLVQSLQAMQPKIKRADGPLAVVVVPTRELAQQSFQIFQKLVKPFTWIVPGVLMGGEKRKAEKARLRKGINILISTPGRLVDHINNTLSIAFSAVRWLVLDEADRTLDLGFEKDLTVILNALNATGPPRQNVLLSATLTEGLSRLAGISMKDPVSVQVSEGPSEGEAGGGAGSFTVPEKLQQHMVLVPSKLRLVCLAAFILAKCKSEKGNKLIVFISSCEAVEFLLALFQAVLCGEEEAAPKRHPSLNFLRLHGNMEQEERTEVFQEFSQCKTGILLCTDVAARGLDLPQVTWIVQYDPPTSATEYVHRVGRTARIGAHGNSLLFLTPSETAYVDVLANHKISLAEMKMEDILATLMQDDRFKGRGKWDHKMSAGALDQEVRERATVLQTDFENVVHANKESVQAAKKALQSFLRAYTTYPSSMKEIFHIRTLHLGHAAKSFGLRDAPQGLAGAGAKAAKGKDQDKRPAKKQSAKERVANLMRSEYGSGMEGESKTQKKKKKRKMRKTEEQESAEG